MGPGDCEICRKLRGSEEPCLPGETYTGEPCAEPELLEENAAAAVLFLGVQTQWRSGAVGPTGLDYSGVEAAARLRGVEMTPDLFARLQVIESAWLKGISDRVEREKPKGAS